MRILGVRVDNLSKKEILEKIGSFLSDGQFHQIATVNPEFILHVQKDAEFKNILNATALNIADGVGIWFAFLRFGKYLKTRIAGTDLMHEILKISEEKKQSVFLAINKNGLSSYDEIYAVLAKMYPNAQFFGDNIDSENTSYKLEARSYKLVLCNFGAPYQEKFINSLNNGIIEIGMGVGGSFDFLTGKVKRAPRILRVLGLEWLWRLVFQPKQRYKRIFNAVVVFPIKVLFSKKQ